MITRVHHFATVVPSIEAGVEIWRDRFGLEVETEATVPEQNVRAALLPCGDGEIELLEALDADSPIGRFLEDGGGIHHVCFQCDDTDAELSRLDGDGVRLVDKVARRGVAGRIGFLHPKATHGVLCELATPGGGVELSPYARPHPPEDTPFRATGFHHCTVAVLDVDAGLATFAANFGLTERTNPFPVPEFGAKAVRVVLANCGIDLTAEVVAGGWLARRLTAKGEGAAALCLTVESLRPGIAGLGGFGFEVALATGSDGVDLAILPPRAASGVTLLLRES